MPFETRMFKLATKLCEREEERRELESRGKEPVSENQWVGSYKFEERQMRMLDLKSFSCGCERRREVAGSRTRIHGRRHRCWLGISARGHLGHGTLVQKFKTRCTDTLVASERSRELG